MELSANLEQTVETDPQAQQMVALAHLIDRAVVTVAYIWLACGIVLFLVVAFILLRMLRHRPAR